MDSGLWGGASTDLRGMNLELLSLRPTLTVMERQCGIGGVMRA